MIYPMDVLILGHNYLRDFLCNLRSKSNVRSWGRLNHDHSEKERKFVVVYWSDYENTDWGRHDSRRSSLLGFWEQPFERPSFLAKVGEKESQVRPRDDDHGKPFYDFVREIDHIFLIIARLVSLTRPPIRERASLTSGWIWPKHIREVWPIHPTDCFSWEDLSRLCEHWI